MSLTLRRFFQLGIIFSLAACQSLPEETYKDYFYQTKGALKNKQFTYILYLGDDSSRESHQGSGQGAQHTSHRKKGGNGHKKKKNSSSKSRKSGDSEYTSIAFQMEEEAYRRLEAKLKAINFCSDQVTYQLSEYTWLRYTIKGSCQH